MTDKHGKPDISVEMFDFDKDGNLVVKRDSLTPEVLAQLKNAKDTKKQANVSENVVARVTVCI